MTNRFSLALALLALPFNMPDAGTHSLKNMAAMSQNNNSSVFPVQSRPYGLSYGDWSALWWYWAFSLPNDHTPLFGTADCSANQIGPVWFLPGAPAGEPGPRQNCTVPPGRSLFVALINAECSNLEGSGNTEGQLRGCADSIGTLIDPNSLKASLDGEPIIGLSHFQVESPLFFFGPLPHNNLITYFCVDQGEGCPEAPAGSIGYSVGVGVYLMFQPLPVGTHTLYFHAEIPAANYIIDTTYHLTVSPHAQ